MKNFIPFLAIALFSILTSCTTEYYESPIPGPAGPQGPQGPAGESSYVFEYTDVNFVAPDFEVILEYPAGFQGLSSDVALVYLLWDIQEVNGVQLDVWRPLPQQVFAPFGIIQYNYDFTRYDVRLFMEGTFDADLLAPVDTDNWVVRVVVVPGDFWNNGRMDPAIDYYELIDQLGYREPDVARTDTGSRRSQDSD